MKKGLLSLLALALTVVGCQNYDDQFEELTSLVESLQSQVNGLSAVRQDVETLQSTVNAINNALGSLAQGSDVDGLSDDLQDLQDQLNDILGDITAIDTRLNDVASAEDLDDIIAQLSDVEEDVHELLTGSAAINQDVIITTPAELDYMESVIEVGENSPEGYIVTGNVIVDFTNLDDDQEDRANVLTAKILTVIGNVDVNGAVDFATLAYIQGNYDVGAADAAEPLLRNVTGNLNIDGRSQSVDYSSLATIGGNVVISNTASVTSLNFNGANITGNLNGGVIVVNNANSVDIGSATITQLTANNATTIDLGQTAITAATVVTATSATNININGVTSASAAITINGTSTTDIRVNALTSATAITVSDSDQAHFPALTSASGVINVTATTAADFSALTSLDANASIGGTTVLLTALTANTTGTLTLPDATTANLQGLVAGNTVVANDATAVNLKALGGSVTLTAPEATTITITDQEDDLTVAAQYPSLTTLNVDGKDVTGVTTFDLTVSAATTLTTVNAGGEISTLDVNGAAVETVTTDGNITTLSLTGTSIDAITLDSTFISGDAAVSITVNNTEVSSLDMSAVEKVKSITLTGNGNLATLVGPSTSALPEAGAAISVTMNTNSLTAAYTAGVSPTAATETTSAVAATEPVITSASVASILAWFNAAAANSTAATSTSIDIENVTVGSTTVSITQAFADDDYANEKATRYLGVIDAAHERAIVTD